MKRRNAGDVAKAVAAPAAPVIIKMPTERAAARTVFASFATYIHYSGKSRQFFPVVANIRGSRGNLTRVPNEPIASGQFGFIVSIQSVSLVLFRFILL